ncbi:hypothetical protein [Lactobacillus helveticus]|uniref:Uncharacterized protein n=1 Tax=Lactobacillus helveticus TaxID=1587 RepID=A0A6A7K0U2_LACHE|nr:hypothetical protein [Lactobacillus helveticus]MPW14182.1 hypothetical protein [Lactobacillus helveticus]
MNTEYRPHTILLIGISNTFKPLYIENPIDMVERQIKSVNQQDFLVLNVAMQRNNKSEIWSPDCGQDITYVEWHIRKVQVKAFYKIINPKKQMGLNAECW